MSDRGHALDHVLGARMVETWMPERRKTKAELAKMDVVDRIHYLAAHPQTDAELYEELEHEVAMREYGMTGEMDPRVMLRNDPPDDWGQ